MVRILTFSMLILCISSYAQWDVIPNGVPTGKLLEQDRFAQMLRDKAADNDPHLPKGYNFNSTPSNFTGNVNYPILSFSPLIKNEKGSLLANISSIKIIDLRFDQDKVGFLPMDNDLQRKFFNRIMGLNIGPSLLNWLKQGFFENHLTLDTNSKRQLQVVLKKFWFTNDIRKTYTVSNPPLFTTLHYDLELFTSLDIGYYHQRSIAGELTASYNNGASFSSLTDSFLVKLKNEILSADFASKETEVNWQSPIDFNDHFNNRMRLVKDLENRPPGLYNSFEDLLSGSPATDSVEMTVKYTNFDMSPLYACQLIAFKNGVHYPVNNAWGYYSYGSFYINTGNGFFVKLYRTKDQYIFYHLKNLQEDRIKKAILEKINFGDNEYLMLRDYTKAFAFTFQLDLETGKLF